MAKDWLSINSLILVGDVTYKGATYCIDHFGQSRCVFRLHYDEDSYIRVETYGKLADECHDFCKSTAGLRVYGRLKQGRFMGEKGEEVHYTYVVAKKIELIKEAVNFNEEMSKESKEKMRDLIEANEAAYYYEANCIEP